MSQQYSQNNGDNRLNSAQSNVDIPHLNASERPKPIPDTTSTETAAAAAAIAATTTPSSEALLKKQLKTHIVICAVSAVAGILFYPFILFALVGKCLNNPSNWTWEGATVSSIATAGIGKIIIFVPFLIATVIWALISGCMITAFGAGVLMLIIMGVCMCIFIIFTFIPLDKVKKEHKSLQGTPQNV